MDTLVAEFLDYLLNTKKYSVHTADAYETDIRDFIQFYETWRGAELLPADLTRIDTIGFRAWLADRGRRDLSHRATARALSSVRSFLRFADKRHGIKNEAIALISSPKIPKKLSKAIETLDVENMTDAAGDVAAEPWIAARDNALVLLIFGCGLRISEALALTDKDIAGRPEVLRITGKGGKERIVPVLPAVWDAIEKYVKIRPFVGAHICAPGCEYAPLHLFRSVRGLPMTPRMAQKVIENLRNALQLPEYVTPHALRHTFATALLSDGADLRTLQELLGHSSLSTTQLYTKVDMSMIASTYAAAHPRAKKLQD